MKDGHQSLCGCQPGKRRPWEHELTAPLSGGRGGQGPLEASRGRVGVGRGLPRPSRPPVTRRADCALPVARLDVARAHGQVSACGVLVGNEGSHRPA